MIQRMMKRYQLTISLVLVLISAPWTACTPTVTCEQIGCPFNETCDAESGLCMGASTDCRDSAICGTEEVCDLSTGECRPEILRCDGGSSCPFGQICNSQTGLCEPAFQCSVSGCGTAEECNLQSQQCEAAGCIQDTDCPNGYLCESRLCTEGCRTTNSRCPLGLSCVVRSGTYGRCEPTCSADSDCPFGQWCDPTMSQATCRVEPPCLENEDCRLDEICLRQTCSRPPCSHNSECSDGEICDTTTGNCIVHGCTDDVYGRGEEESANHSYETAATLVAGEYAALTLCPGRTDWFKIAVRESELIRVRLDLEALHPDVDVYVYDANRQLVAWNQELGQTSTLRIGANTAGWLWIAFRTYSQEPISYRANLGLSFCEPDPFEDNDKHTAATPIPTVPQTPSELRLTTCGFDEDWFVLPNLAAEDGLRLLTREGSADLSVVLLTPDGLRLPIRRDTALSIPRVGLAGDYFIQARSTLGQTSAYRMVFELLEPYSCLDPVDNTTKEDSVALEAGVTKTATLCPSETAWETDWYTFSVENQRRIQIEIVPGENVSAIQATLWRDSPTEWSVVRSGRTVDSRILLEAPVVSGETNYLQITSHAPVGRIFGPPQYTLNWLDSSI
jgi:hypothetical protein